jgi:hypothetical protein
MPASPDRGKRDPATLLLAKSRPEDFLEKSIFGYNSIERDRFWTVADLVISMSR